MEVSEKIPTGILYREDKLDFHRKNGILNDGTPLIKRETQDQVLKDLISSFI
jgi:2-oxoglutarate ferredoxin oxidoreductase subunit beta